MAEKTVYLLDTSPLIEAKRRYYGFDYCPAFWDTLQLGHEREQIYSIDRVKAEIDREQDVLTAWVKSDLPASFFLDSRTPQVVNEFAQMMQWVQGKDQFTSAAKMEFARADNADGWLIATARATGMTVITHEAFSADAKKRVMIPNVCREFDVPCANTFEMIRELNAQFVLQ